MIAMMRFVSMFLFCTLLAGVSARAQDATPQNFSSLDDQVALGVAAYHAGDYQRAKEILWPLAEAGQPKAMNMIGMLHRGTPVLPNDPIAECDWYERAAQAGYASGMHNLGICYERGRGRPHDPKATQQWFTKAAENGDIEAMLYLGGQDGVSGEERRYWLKKAADQGSRVAAVNLWLDGHREDAPNFSLLDELCIAVRIMLFNQGLTACDD